MAEVKWIKITTDMFDDDKIDFICSLPEADAIVHIWVRLLTMAGKCNAGGYIFLTENIPYTDEMLSHKFKKPINIVRLALETFNRLEMLESDEKGYYLPNFEKHQNIEGLEKIKEQTRKRVAGHRLKQKLLLSNVTCNATVTQSNATDKEEDKDKEKRVIKKHSYAEFVKMEEQQYQKLVDKYGLEDTSIMIETLNNYKGSKGKNYKSDYHAILKWVVNDVLTKKPKPIALVEKKLTDDELAIEELYKQIYGGDKK